MKGFTYKGAKTKQISFPLGGIGTGCIGLAGNGSLIDWEIFNRPNKGALNAFSHFAVKAERGDEVIDARVLNGGLQPPYENLRGGMGPLRETMGGVPHFTDVEFAGRFPLAELTFKHERFPGVVRMTAFNPFIPLNDKDSSIPGAFFEIELENKTDQAITYSVGCSVGNPLPRKATVNTYRSQGSVHMIRLGSSELQEDEPGYGDLTVATDCPDVSYQESWYRGQWFDSLEIFWRDFVKPGPLKNRTYADPGSWDMCSLVARVNVSPGEKRRVRFVITWNFPNCHNYWNPEKCNCEQGDCKNQKPKTWKNYYATVFADSTESAVYALTNWVRLHGETVEFTDALFSSTLPDEALDAISANISILKSPTCLRLEDGSFYGFEGCFCNSGCCEGSCTHVWNYAYALPFLFPKLERSMRDLDYRYNQREDGGMAFRLQLPIGRERSRFRPCVDGQFGGVIKAYRDWKISGDTEWLKSNWGAIKKSIDFAWAETNEDKWDADKDGVLEGRQHHTLDVELFGPSSWLGGFYLAALKAGAEMAEFLGEKEKAKEYLSVFERGKRWVDQHLFNGEYYHQIVDLKDKTILERFDAVGYYWNEEAGEIKYQIGEGCAIDQVLAQWHANICGLGEVLDREQTRKALRSIYRNNFKKNIGEYFNSCRLYAVNDEAGVVICEWPEGVYKPAVPLTYASETMNGFEYQVAIHMIQEGMVDEGLEIVKAIRDRYDGERRNPWNEFECGSNYARSMASYALLPALSGFEFDMVSGVVGFDPVPVSSAPTDRFVVFWCLDSGWGVFGLDKDRCEIKVLYGELNVREFRIPSAANRVIGRVSVSGADVRFERSSRGIRFGSPVRIEKGSTLSISFA